MVYHASQQAGLTRLLPHASTHGTPYVYAINNRLTALFFGAPKDDFDLLLDEEEGRPVVYECYPNALERVYSGKPCSLYTRGGRLFGVPDRVGAGAGVSGAGCRGPGGAHRRHSGGNPPGSVPGGCTVRRYSEDGAYQEMLREELGSRIRDFGLSREQMAGDWRFPRCFPWLMEKFE